MAGRPTLDGGLDSYRGTPFSLSRRRQAGIPSPGDLQTVSERRGYALYVSSRGREVRIILSSSGQAG